MLNVYVRYGVSQASMCYYSSRRRVVRHQRSTDWRWPKMNAGLRASAHRSQWRRMEWCLSGRKELTANESRAKPPQVQILSTPRDPRQLDMCFPRLCTA